MKTGLNPEAEAIMAIHLPHPVEKGTRIHQEETGKPKMSTF
jgi:hypothetical protein